MARFIAAANAAALSLILAGPTWAQTYRDVAGSVVPGFVPIGGDGSGPLFTASNPGRISGSFSATFSGFQPTPAYSWQAATASSATYALPTGSVVIFYNTGANPITVKLGTSGVSVAAGQADVIQPNAWMAFTVGTATYYAVIGNGGASSVVASGGSGLPTGAGGGGAGSVGTAAQGSPAAVANAWPVYETIGGAAASATNPVPVSPGGGATFPVSGSVSVSNFPATQPISAASLPLPSSAATATNQTTGNASLATIATNTTGVATAANQTSVIGAGGSGGTAAASSILMGGTCCGGLSLSTGQQGPLQVTANGALYTSLAAIPAEAPPGGTGTVGSVGLVGMGLAASTPPSFTAGQFNYLSQTTLGGLRADLSTVGGTALTAVGTETSGTVQTVNAHVTNSVVTTPKAGTFSSPGCTVGTTSGSCLIAGTYNHVLIENTSASASIACTWSGSAAALNASGSITLSPGGSMLWGPATAGVPSANGLNCIASAASAPLYLESN